MTRPVTPDQVIEALQTRWPGAKINKRSARAIADQINASLVAPEVDPRQTAFAFGEEWTNVANVA